MDGGDWSAFSAVSAQQTLAAPFPTCLLHKQHKPPSGCSSRYIAFPRWLNGSLVAITADSQARPKGPEISCTCNTFTRVHLAACKVTATWQFLQQIGNTCTAPAPCTVQGYARLPQGLGSINEYLTFLGNAAGTKRCNSATFYISSAVAWIVPGISAPTGTSTGRCLKALKGEEGAAARAGLSPGATPKLAPALGGAVRR